MAMSVTQTAARSGQPGTEIKAEMVALGQRARAASRRLALATTAEKNAALKAMAEAIRSDKDAILSAAGAFSVFCASRAAPRTSPTPRRPGSPARSSTG